MINELETFAAVVRCGSMSRAATELHLSQPAVSQRLRALEEEYGMPLLRRTNRGVELTQAGEILARYARRLLSLNGALQEEMAALRNSEPRQVVIGATSAIGGYALPCTIYLFQQKHPSAKIQLVVGKRSDTLQRLQDGGFDLALVEGASSECEAIEGWQCANVSEEELVLITPTSGPLAEPPAFTLGDLQRVPLIVREPGSGTREVVEQELLKHGLRLDELNVVMELSGVEGIKTSVAAGHGVAITSKWCVRAEARMGQVRIAPLEGIRFVSRWTLLYPSNGNRSGLTRALLRTLRSPAERGFC